MNGAVNGMAKHFAGRVAVVTGAASGIGNGLAQRLVEGGARVVLADVNAARLEDAVRALGSPERVRGHVTDVADRESVQALADFTAAEFGGADLLFNNAGVGGYVRFTATTIDAWRWMMDVNLMGVVHGIHAFLPQLASSDEAHIVSTASISGVVHGQYLSPYVAAKAGVVGLTETLSQEFATEFPHISLSVICPGPVDTNISQSDRLAPAGVPTFDEADPDLKGLREQRAQNKRESMSPLAAADVILKGVAEGRLHIFTDEQHRDRFEARVARIIEDWKKSDRVEAAA